jgi:hypothetical protein
MEQRARPRKKRPQPIWILVRMMMAVYAYGQARDAGEKHSVAISEAVTYIRATYARMRVSETEVKRIMAQWRSKRRATCLFVSQPDAQHNSITLPNGRKVRILYTASVGPHPRYPRANAAARPQEGSRSVTASQCGCSVLRDD